MNDPAWLLQTTTDVSRHEGFRPFPYPDPLSRWGRMYKGAKYRWGFKPPRMIMAELGLSAADAKNGAPWTNGFGETKGVTIDTPEVAREPQLKKLRDRVIEHANELVKIFPEWRNYPVVIQTVLANMIYNLGYKKLAAFDTTIGMIKRGEYARAADNLTKTAWHKQVGDRALELEQRLRTGKIESKHLVVAIKDDFQVKPDFSGVTGRVFGPNGELKQ